jgi:hypothetical protein
MNPFRQEQVGTPFNTSHLVLEPHGLGRHCSSEMEIENFTKLQMGNPVLKKCNGTELSTVRFWSAAVCTKFKFLTVW